MGPAGLMLLTLVHSFSETDKHNYAGVQDDGKDNFSAR